MPTRRRLDRKTNRIVEEEYSLPAGKLRFVAREQAVDRTQAYLVSLLKMSFPRIESMDEARQIIGTIFDAVIPAARSAPLTLVARQYQYGVAKITEIRGMTTDQANAYDPASDEGWPH